MSITAKELRGKAGKASIACYRMKAEIERKYAGDPVGYKFMRMFLYDVEEFLDDVAGPLLEAQDFEEACDLRGIARFGVGRIDRTIDALLEYKSRLDGCKSKVIRIVKATKVEA